MQHFFLQSSVQIKCNASLSTTIYDKSQHKSALPDEMLRLQHQSVTSFKCQKQNKNTHNEKICAI